MASLEDQAMDHAPDQQNTDLRLPGDRWPEWPWLTAG